jgi:hypothetical protein
MPIDYTIAPTNQDVYNLLAQASFLKTAMAGFTGEYLESVAGAAATEWNKRTNYHPFVAPELASAKRFDPPGPSRRGRYQGGGRLLNLRAGLVELTSLKLQPLDDPSDSETLVEGEDFFLEDANAPADGKPYTQVRFARNIWGKPQSLLITGRWGYADEYPADAWEAIRQYAALLALTGLNIEQDVASISQPGLTKELDTVGTITPKDILIEWPKLFRAAAKRYRRKSI